MRKYRVAAAATSLALVGAVSSVGFAGAATNGVGTAEADTTVLSVSVGGGSLLSASLLGDGARSTIDKSVATPEAFSRLTGLNVASSVQALNLGNVGGTTFESRTPGGQPSVTGASVNLSQPVTGLNIPASVASGTLNLANLTSAVDNAGARSAMTAQATNVNLVGGLLSISGISSNLGTTAAPTASTGTRSVKVDQVAVANLGALLQGLGISLTSLPLATIEGLLDQVQATVPGVGNGAALQGVVDGVQTQIASLNAAVTGGTGIADTAVATIVGAAHLDGVIPANTVSTIAAIADPVARANALIDQIQASLGSVLSNAVTTLAATNLLQVNGIDIGVSTKAAQTVADSSADVTAKVGSVTVAGITLPGVDLLSAATTVSTLVNNVNTKLQSVLGTISPDLANLVKVSVLDQTKSVTADGAYNRSRAGITALTATVTPPANLAAVVTAVTNAVGSIGAAISATQVTQVPVVGATMAQLGTALGAVNALSAGATVKVVQVLGASDFAPGGGSTPNSDLPRTGDDDLLMTAVATLLIALGLGLRTWFAQPVRIKE